MRFVVCLFALLALFSTACEGHGNRHHHHGRFFVAVPRRVFILTRNRTAAQELEFEREVEKAQPCLPMDDSMLMEDLEEDTECSSVVDTAEAAGLNTLVAAVNAASLAEILGPDFVGTVFAPTEEAFSTLLTQLNVTAEDLLANTDLLTQVLLVHVVPDVVAFSTDLRDGQQIPTAAEGANVAVSIQGDDIFIVAPSGVVAQVVVPNIRACDAVVHVIDQVLTPDQ